MIAFVVAFSFAGLLVAAATHLEAGEKFKDAGNYLAK
jgi:hypothetical protein